MRGVMKPDSGGAHLTKAGRRRRLPDVDGRMPAVLQAIACLTHAVAEAL